jgi:DNA repair photolyase
MNQEKSLKFEPHAALPIERFLALEEAHDRGIETWVSLEPVIDPSETLYIINRTHSYVDSYKIGKLNYRPEAKKVDWTKFVREAVNLLESYNKKYYIKKSLQGHI